LADQLGKQEVRARAAALPPFPKCKLLDKMRVNPRNDWQVKDVETLCAQIGLTCTSPSSGSHYKVSSPHLAEGTLTIPAKRPIKPVYIKHLVSLAETHWKYSPENTDG
jgi:hypothetical protein